MPKNYHTPKRSHIIKNRLDDEEYSEFLRRLELYGMNQSEFLRRAITGASVRPIIAVHPVNDELLSALGKITAEYGKIGSNLNQIARSLNEYHTPYPQLAAELRNAATHLATLKFEPSRNKDDLLVYISYGEGENKQTIVKRLAGKDKEGQNYGEAIEPVNGVYTIEGLTFAENSNVKFDLRLEGTQYLEQGAYVYVAENGLGDSQTMVGIAEGTRNVDVSASVTINFNVDENNYVKTEHKWYDESDPVREPEEDTKDPPEYPTDPQDDDYEIEEEDVPLVDIPDEEIPLANVPQTGANNTSWSALAAVAGLMMAVVALGKKNK